MPAILKDRQDHPVRGDVMHVDFLEVNLKEKIQSTVMLELEGIEDAPGVKEGGVLDLATREINIEALPTDIPDLIMVDVSAMDMGDTLTLAVGPRPRGRRVPGRRGGDGCGHGHPARRSRRSPRRSRRRPSWWARTASPSRARPPRATRRGVRARTRRRLRRLRVAPMAEAGGRVDWLIVGLGNPGPKYERTRHNVGFDVLAELMARWDLPHAKKNGRASTPKAAPDPGGPRVGLLAPLTYMNEAGNSVGPARGALGLELDRVVAVYDEIDLPFGRIEARLGGGLAGHNGLKSLKRGLGSADFRRVRVGVGGRTPPTPRSCPPTCWGASASRRTRSAPRRGRGRRGRAAHRRTSSPRLTRSRTVMPPGARRPRLHLGDRGGQAGQGVRGRVATSMPTSTAAAVALSWPSTPALSVSSTRTSSSPYSPWWCSRSLTSRCSSTRPSRVALSWASETESNQRAAFSRRTVFRPARPPGADSIDSPVTATVLVGAAQRDSAGGDRQDALGLEVGGPAVQHPAMLVGVVVQVHVPFGGVAQRLLAQVVQDQGLDLRAIQPALQRCDPRRERVLDPVGQAPGRFRPRRGGSRPRSPPGATPVAPEAGVPVDEVVLGRDHVRRVADDEVELLARDRVEPAALAPRCYRCR